MIFEELDNLLKEVIRLQIKPNFARYSKRDELLLANGKEKIRNTANDRKRRTITIEKT